jgi:hypothetical protein
MSRLAAFPCRRHADRSGRRSTTARARGPEHVWKPAEITSNHIHSSRSLQLHHGGTRVSAIFQIWQ